MKKSIKHIVTVLSCLILTAPLFCQNSISYSYDSAGNRVSRVSSAANSVSALAEEHDFYQVAIACSIISSGIIRIPYNDWRSEFMRFYSFKSSQLKLDSCDEGSLIQFKSKELKKDPDRIAMNHTLMKDQDAYEKL